MAKGAQSKDTITKKLLETFKGSFLDGKVLRVPMIEDGEEVQIKITLTTAKDLITPDGDAVEKVEPEMLNFEDGAVAAQETSKVQDITPEEQENIRNLLGALF